jgi:hypothetical protein
MAARLPAITHLADDIRAVRRGNETVDGALGYLVAQQARLQTYPDVEELGIAAYGENPDRNALALAVNLQFVRNALLEELWRREIFIGVEVLDDLLFHSARRSGVTDPLLAVLEFLRDRRATRPGLVVFPLHSIGILRAGLLRGNNKQFAQFMHPDWGIALSPQTNALDQTIDFLERARQTFGVHKPIDDDLVAHWYRSRAKWLERNPILAIRMTTQRGSYYDTERVVVSRVKAATAQIAMVAAFQRPDPDRTSALFTSSRVNNWETLDIHHYIVLSDNPGRPRTLDGDCVPIHGRGSPIVELSDLSVELDPRYRGSKRTIEAIDQSVAAAYRGHLQNMWRRRRTVRTRTYDRLFEALTYYRRSLHGGGRSWSSTVSLATAFEMVLTDSYAANVTSRLQRRLRLVLQGVPGTRAFQAAFSELYKARGDLVHAGAEADDIDLHVARQAFVHAFCAVTSRVETLPNGAQSPMLVLTGDDPAAD